MIDKDKPICVLVVGMENSFYIVKTIIKVLSRKRPGYKTSQEDIKDLRTRVLGEKHTFQEVIDIVSEYVTIRWSHEDFRVKKK